MKKKRAVILMILLILMVSALTFASDTGIVKIQGTVMAVDLKKNILIINERSFACGNETAIYNEKRQAIALDKVKVRQWVYVESVPDKVNRVNVAKKIYFIPKYVHEKEKHLYPFME